MTVTTTLTNKPVKPVIDRAGLLDVVLRAAGLASLTAAGFVVGLVVGLVMLGLSLLTATYLP